MFRTAVRTVLAHKARLLMTLLSVTLGVTFVAGTLVFTGSVTEAYARSSERSVAGVDVAIRAAATGDAAANGRLLGRRLLDRAAALPAAASATGTASGFTALATRDGGLAGAGRPTRGAGYGGETLTEGRAPRAADEVLLDARTAARTGYGVGDTVRLSVTGPVLRARVTGIFATDDGGVAAGGSLTLFDPATAQRLFARPGHYNRIELTARPGSSPDELRAQAERVLPPGTQAVTAARLAAEQTERDAATITAFSHVLLACAAIALFVGGFLIVNTFTMLVAQRTRELALLRAVGATRRQVTRSVLTEAALVGLAASTAGLGAGVGVAAAVRAVLSASGSTLPDGPLVVSTGAVAASLALGVGITVLAAWLPARRAAKVPPVAALGGVHAPSSPRSLRMRHTLGALLAAPGCALVVATAAGTGSTSSLGLGTALLVTGVLVLTPALSRPVIAAASPLLRQAGVSGRLAGRNALRDPRRTAATASALTIGLTLVTGLTVLGAGADRAVRELAATGYLRADYLVSMAGDGALAPETERRLRALDEVTSTSPRVVTQARVGGLLQEVTGFRAATADELLGLNLVEGSFASTGQTAVVDDQTSAAHGWRPGDTLPVVWADGARGRLRLTGVYRDSFDDGVKTDVSVLAPHLDRTAASTVFVKTAHGPSEETARALARTLGDSPAVRISDKEHLVDDITGAVGVVLAILYGMLALAVVIAVLGVVNTLALSVHERTPEIGLLRAVGLDRRSAARMIRLESLVVCLFGGLLGLGLGVLFGWAAGELAAAQEGIDVWALVLPWDRLGLILAASALVGVAASFWPVRRAARLDVLTAIGSD
ncbi:FtsX-like permease family protein [Streptomyces sp. NPDC051940]|uniref:ABC transporter permease n=1 Tax=Streptomyces sp. NPDC051940 TaxID=3155675 RepID=UPI0034453955